MSKAPKLRFKEFSGDWESKYGENIATKITKGSSPKWQGFNYQSEGVLFVTSENVRDGYLDISEPKYLPLEFNEKQKSSSLVKGDILINIVGASIGRICEFNLDNVIANVNQAVCVLRVENETTRKFINYHLQTSEIKKVLFGTQTESARPNLSLADIRGLEFNLPKTKEEQEKISSFFSLIDNKISLQGDKVDALKDYKRGMMQKIFSRELRFKDDEGRDYPEWEEKKLGECIENKGGTALEKFVDENGTHKFISIGNYSTRGKYIDSGQRISLNDKTKEKLLDKNDLVMVLNDKTATGDLIGSTILIDEDNTYIYNQRSERLICNENINPNFAWILLNYEGFRKRVFSIAQGGTQIYVNFSSVKNLNIQLPSLKEQNKISEFILSLDNKLEKEQEKLNSLNEYKKGLLKQMFV